MVARQPNFFGAPPVEMRHGGGYFAWKSSRYVIEVYQTLDKKSGSWEWRVTFFHRGETLFQRHCLAPLKDRRSACRAVERFVAGVEACVNAIRKV